jgi:hypothetical protein
LGRIRISGLWGSYTIRQIGISAFVGSDMRCPTTKIGLSLFLVSVFTTSVHLSDCVNRPLGTVLGVYARGTYLGMVALAVLAPIAKKLAKKFKEQFLHNDPCGKTRSLLNYS